MDKKNLLTEKDLEEYWKNFTGLSDDEIDFNDEHSDEDCMIGGDDEADVEEDERNPTGSGVQEDSEDEEDLLPLSSFLPLRGAGQSVKKDILWKSKSLILNEDQLRFHGDVEVSEQISALERPVQFFNYFFSSELVKKILEETNLYAVQSKPERPPSFDENDIRQFFGILIYTSLVNMPNTRSMWNDELRFAPVADVMPINKFETIRRFIHFNNNDTFIPRDQAGHDRLHKIRPVIDFLNDKFSSVALEQNLSIDEQMCSTKVRHFMKQYMPMKPHKWGFKFFVMSGISGFAYKFEIYAGQEKKNVPTGEPDLGVTSNLVLRLASIIPRQKNYRLYHDNYYTSIPLMVHLAKEGIYSLGTIRRNRVPNCKLPTESTMKNVDRGTSYEFVATIDGVDVSSVIWKDNKCVTLVSSFAGKTPISKVRRYDRKVKKIIEVDCPYIITEYNRHMGGVDLMDSFMGRYKIYMKSRKWYIRIFYHLLDMSLVNSWLLYKRVHSKKQPACKLLNQAQFRAEVAYTLCNLRSVANKRGRPSINLEQEIENKRKRGPMKHIPPSEVRADQTGHWPSIANKKIRCKLPNCKGFTHTICEKCGVGLCLNKHNNCFKQFHM